MSWRDDPRNAGQEVDLPPGTVLRWTAFAASEAWDHEHCVICWAKFAADPRLGADDDPVLPAGYATTEAHPHGAGYHWVCATCADELAAELGWTQEGRPAPD